MKVAEKLVEDHRARRQFEPFASTCGIATVAQAYAAQRDFVALRTRNAPVVGYKVGLTSEAMQKQCGLDAPSLASSRPRTCFKALQSWRSRISCGLASRSRSLRG